MSGFDDLILIDFGDVQVMSGRASDGRWCAWGKVGRLVAKDPIEEPGVVCFEFGKGRCEAVENLLLADFPGLVSGHVVGERVAKDMPRFSLWVVVAALAIGCAVGVWWA